MDKFLIRKRKTLDDRDNSEEILNNNQNLSKLVTENVQNPEPSTSNVNIKNSYKKQMPIYRKYNEKYLAFGFSWIGDKDCPSPICLICDITLANESMVPSKLERHILTKHPDFSKKSFDFFKKLEDSQEKQQKRFCNMVKVSDKAQQASYAVAEMLAQKMKSHLTAESVILPACRSIVNIMLGKKAETEIMKVPLSNNTISRKINDMSEDIEIQVLQEIKLSNKKFALQVDESTDISGKAQLISFVRFVQDDDIINQFLCCKELKEKTTGADIFSVMNQYFIQNSISWKSCVSVCTDGAPSMVGCIKGFLALVRKENPNVSTTHCFIHREALVAKATSTDLQEVLNQVVKIVNYIKSKPQQIRMFGKLCEAMQSNHKTLIMHTEVRWLSKGRVLARVCELREELLAYFTAEKSIYSNFLGNDTWNAKLSFLADLFEHLNKLNLSMQGRDENILVAQDKMLAFKEKLKIWLKHIAEKNLEMFPLLNLNKYNPDIVELVRETLEKLNFKIDQYFPSIDVKVFDWVRNPFIFSTPSSLNLKEEEELAEVRNNRSLQIYFNKETLSRFWINMGKDYPNISERAIDVLLPFSTSYLCELGFSALTEIKQKKRTVVISRTRVTSLFVHHKAQDSTTLL